MNQGHKFVLFLQNVWENSICHLFNHKHDFLVAALSFPNFYLINLCVSSSLHFLFGGNALKYIHKIHVTIEFGVGRFPHILFSLQTHLSNGENNWWNRSIEILPFFFFFFSFFNITNEWQNCFFLLSISNSTIISHDIDKCVFFLTKN